MGGGRQQQYVFEAVQAGEEKRDTSISLCRTNVPFFLSLIFETANIRIKNCPIWFTKAAREKEKSRRQEYEKTMHGKNPFFEFFHWICAFSTRCFLFLFTWTLKDWPATVLVNNVKDSTEQGAHSPLKHRFDYFYSWKLLCKKKTENFVQRTFSVWPGCHFSPMPTFISRFFTTSTLPQYVLHTHYIPSPRRQGDRAI